MAFWWLSFADGDKEPGTQFLGVAIVEGQNVQAAVERAAVLGIDPGGEVAAWAVPPEFQARIEPHVNRLLLGADLAATGFDGKRLGENPEARAAATMVCKCCNGMVHKRSVH